MCSFTWRLTFWYALVLIVIFLICGAAAYWGTRYLLFSTAAGEAANVLASVQKLAAGEDNTSSDSNHVDLDDPQLTAAAGENTFVQVTGVDGRVINASPGLKGNFFPLYAGPPVQKEIGGEKVLVAGVRLPQGAVIQVIRPLSREENFLETLSRIFTLVSLAGLFLALAGGWVITYAALSPVRTLTTTARQISATDLGRRIELRGAKDELYTLGETFNQMLDRLEKGFLSQQEFIAAASHDLRTPLTVIRSYADLLSRWGKADPAVLAESLQAIGRATEIMSRLVDDLLLIASLQNRPVLTCRPFNLAEAAEEMAAEAKAVYPGIDFELAGVQTAVVSGDADHLRRALWALVDNAGKYSRPGGKVTLSTGRNDREAFFSVQDTGPGIPAEELPRVFERFYRSDQARGQGKGFGLGLALAKEIVEAHGGRIEVRSIPGEGSRFTVTLPGAKGEA
jgi:signal transduction histidine kinase